MAKKGLDISTMQAVLKDVQINLGWSLCIGAGTSVPALPDWFSLVERLINHNYNPPFCERHQCVMKHLGYLSLF